MDNLDMQIISRLLNNCREPDRQIGKKLGMSGGAVNSRIKKMQESGVIEHFMLRVEPATLGYGVVYVVVPGHDPDVILKQARLVGEPYLMVPCIGGVIVCGIVARDEILQKAELAQKLMAGSRVLSVIEADRTGSGLTRTDLSIMDQLMKSPRQSNESVAKVLGLSTKTVARSIEKMQEDDSVLFTLVHNPTKMDNCIPHVIVTSVKGRADEVLGRLEGEFAESFMQIPFIAKDQIALFMYSDNIFKLDELTHRVRGVAGVESADLFIPKSIVFMQEWISGAIRNAKSSPTLHIPGTR